MKTIQLVGGSVAVTANNPATLTPNDVTYVPGDLILILAGSRAVPTVQIAQPLGWRQLAQRSGMSLIGRIAGSRLDGVDDSMPVLRFIGGAAGDDGMAFAYVIRFTHNDILSVMSTATALQTNAAAQNVDTPTITTTSDGNLVLTLAVKQDDITGCSKAGHAVLGTASSTAGSDASAMMLGLLQTAAGTIAAGTITVTGGGAAASYCFLAALRPYVTSLAYPALTDSPCDFIDVMRESFLALSAKLHLEEVAIDALVNRPAYRVSNTNVSVTQNDNISWSSVDIDPTGDIDLIVEPDAITVDTGLWITGSGAIVSYSGTAGNHAMIYSNDATHGSHSEDFDATGYPPSGGNAMTFSRIFESLSADSKIPTVFNVTGAGVPDPQVVVYAVSYAVRMSD